MPLSPIEKVQTLWLFVNLSLKAVARLETSLLCECFSLNRNCWWVHFYCIIFLCLSFMSFAVNRIDIQLRRIKLFISCTRVYNSQQWNINNVSKTPTPSGPHRHNVCSRWKPNWTGTGRGNNARWQRQQCLENVICMRFDHQQGLLEGCKQTRKNGSSDRFS